LVGMGLINLVLTSAFHTSSSIVGSGVVLFLWCSKPLYFCPRYANLSAISRVLYLEASNAFGGAFGGLRNGIDAGSLFCGGVARLDGLAASCSFSLIGRTLFWPVRSSSSRILAINCSCVHASYPAMPFRCGCNCRNCIRRGTLESLWKLRLVQNSLWSERWNSGKAENDAEDFCIVWWGTQ
jgi:hypothetical protein